MIVGVGPLPEVALEDSETTCVYYAETSGSCITRDSDENGDLTESRFYVFWGTWCARIS